MESSIEQKPDFAIRVMVFKEGKILLGKNKGKHGTGSYTFVGGHLEYMESIEDCIKRELLEECGIEVENIKLQSVLSITDYPPFHSVHITYTANWKTGEPQVLEPEKIEDWGWYDLDNLPKLLFRNVELSLEEYKKGLQAK